MFKRLLMAIKGKRNIGRGAKQSASSSIFLKSEALFIGQKLQQANYKGEVQRLWISSLTTEAIKANKPSTSRLPHFLTFSISKPHKINHNRTLNC